jgi:hypothetical protein
VQEEELADPLVGLTLLVPDMGLGVEGARQDAQVRQPADERVGRRLEHAHEERAVRVRRDFDRLARLVGRRRRAFVGRGGEVPDDRVEEGLQAGPGRGAADEDRREDGLLDALPEAGFELGVRDLLALEVLHQDLVVGLGGGLEQLVAAAGHLVGEAVGDRDLDLLPALGLVRLAMDEVDVAAERVGRTDRDLERRDLRAERRPEGVERAGRVGVLLVAFVDEEAGGGVRAAAEGDRLLEAGLDPARRVGHEDRAVGGVEARHHLGREVEVARSVDDRDPGPVRLERRDREAQRLAALLLLGLEVEMGAAVLDLADAPDGAGSKEELLAERRLAGTRVTGQDDAPEVGQVDALHGHWGSILVQRRVFGRGPAILVPYTRADVGTLQMVDDQAREGRH